MSQTGKTPSPGIYKVSEGVLINKDNEALMAYKKRKLRERRLDVLEEKIIMIDTKLSDIETSLRKLLDAHS